MAKKKEQQQTTELAPVQQPAPEQKPDVVVEKSAPSGTPEVYKSSETGKLSGVSVNDKEFLGLTAAQVRKIAAQQEGKSQSDFAIPPGTQLAGTAANLQEEQRNKLIIQQQQEQLGAKRIKEQQEVASLIDKGEQADRLTRYSRAGVIPFKMAEEQINKLFGKEGGKGIEQYAETNPIIKAMTATAGFFLTSGIPIGERNISPSLLFTGYSKNAKELAADAVLISGRSFDILKEVRDGFDPIQASIILERDEAAIRQRYADATNSIKKDPLSVATGQDLQEDLAATLTTVQTRRRIIENYAITHDKTELILATQGDQSTLMQA